MLHYDDVLEDFVGEFGTYQIICYIVLGMTAIPTGLIIILPVFMYAWTNSWCKVPHMADISQQFCIDNFTSNCEELVMNLTIPRERIDGECGVTWAFSQCFRYNVTPSDWLTYAVEEPDINSLINNTAIVPCDNGWDYDTSEYRSTVSQQFDLVCDRYYLNALASSIFMSGQLIGCLVDGYIIDKLGRMKGLIITISGSLVFGIAQAFAPNYIIFSVLSFVLSACIYGVYLSGFVLACEYVGPSKRTTTGMIYPMFYSIGYMLLALLAYFVREWWILQLIIVCPCILFLSYYWFIPESPRWLISMGRTQEAERIIKQCAKVNGRSLPVDLFNDSWIKDSKEDISDQHKHGILDLFRYSNMRKTTLILIYCWVTLNLAYYGISYDTSNLGGNPYLNLFIAGAVEIPAYGLGIFAMESSVLGRRGSIMITFLFGGVSCICLAWLPPCGDLVWLGITLAMFGKFGITSAFGMIYVYGAELFPTPLRSIGVGMCATFARTGSILAPQLILIGEAFPQLPPVVFGVTCIVAGCLIYILPETRGQKLPETILEAEQFGRKKKHSLSYPGYGEIRRLEVNDNYELKGY